MATIGTRTLVPRFRGADGSGGVEAAHRRHLDVHEDDVEALAGDGGDGFGAVVGDHRLVTEAGEHRRGQPLVDHVVFRHEDAQPAQRRRQRGRGGGRGAGAAVPSRSSMSAFSARRSS